MHVSRLANMRNGVDVLRNWPNRRVSRSCFRSRDSRRVFLRVSPRFLCTTLPPPSLSLSLCLSSSIVFGCTSSISVVTTTKSLPYQWSLTSHSREYIIDVFVPFINGTWHIENCFTAAGRDEKEDVRSVRYHRF